MHKYTYKRIVSKAFVMGLYFPNYNTQSIKFYNLFPISSTVVISLLVKTIGLFYICAYTSWICILIILCSWIFRHLHLRVETINCPPFYSLDRSHKPGRKTFSSSHSMNLRCYILLGKSWTIMWWGHNWNSFLIRVFPFKNL